MSKTYSPYIIPILTLSLIFSTIPLLATTVHLRTSPIASWWDDLFGGSSEKESTDSLYDIYIKFEDIDGECTATDHENWIDVISVNFSMFSPASGDGATRRRGEIIFEDILITKKVDKSTPKLMEKCAISGLIPMVKIDVLKNFDGYMHPVIKYEFINVILTSYISSAAEGSDSPIDTLTISYEEIKVTYTEYDSDGISKGNVEWSYKIELGEI